MREMWHMIENQDIFSMLMSLNNLSDVWELSVANENPFCKHKEMVKVGGNDNVLCIF